MSIDTLTDKFICTVELVGMPPSDNQRLLAGKRGGGGYVLGLGARGQAIVQKRAGCGRYTLNPTYRAYKKYGQAEFLVARAMYRLPLLKPSLKHPLYADISFSVPKVRGDVSNCLKCLLDCGKGILYEDDKYVLPQIKGLHADPILGNARVTIHFRWGD